MKSVYLAGPIAGLHYYGAAGWRDYAIGVFKSHGVHAKSPLRDKQHLASETVLTDQGYSGSPLTTQKGIVARDRNDCQKSDLVLMNLQGCLKASIGSMVELGWADSARVPIVVVLDLEDETNPHTHAFVKELAGFIVPTLDEGIRVALSLLDAKLINELTTASSV